MITVNKGQNKITNQPCNLNGISYFPIVPPCADSEELSTIGERLVLYHSRNGSKFFTQPLNEIGAGWAIGLIRFAK